MKEKGNQYVTVNEIDLIILNDQNLNHEKFYHVCKEIWNILFLALAKARAKKLHL